MAAKRSKLGEVVLDVVENENPSSRAELPDKSVESGQNIGDHTKMEPTILSLSGVIVGDNAANKLAILKKYQREGKLLKYVGRNLYNNVSIASLNTEHNGDNQKGFNFDITLKQIRIARPETFVINVKPTKKKTSKKKTVTKVKKRTNKGRQQPKKKQITKSNVKKIKKKKRVVPRGAQISLTEGS